MILTTKDANLIQFVNKSKLFLYFPKLWVYTPCESLKKLRILENGMARKIFKK